MSKAVISFFFSKAILSSFLQIVCVLFYYVFIFDNTLHLKMQQKLLDAVSLVTEQITLFRCHCTTMMTKKKLLFFCSCSDEIAGCIEKAYEQIQFTEATRVLFFTSSKKMTEYAKKVPVLLLIWKYNMTTLTRRCCRPQVTPKRSQTSRPTRFQLLT